MKEDIRTQKYEYVVWDLIDDCIHHGPWSEEECLSWIQKAREMFPDGDPDKVWIVRRRPVGEWESYE